jgi:hypothetical protein
MVVLAVLAVLAVKHCVLLATGSGDVARCTVSKGGWLCMGCICWHVFAGHLMPGKHVGVECLSILADTEVFNTSVLSGIRIPATACMLVGPRCWHGSLKKSQGTMLVVLVQGCFAH